MCGPVSDGIAEADVEERVGEDDLRSDRRARDLGEPVGRRIVVEDETVGGAAEGDETRAHHHGGQRGREGEATECEQGEAPHLLRAAVGAGRHFADGELVIELGRDEVCEEGGGEDRDEHEDLPDACMHAW